MSETKHSTLPWTIGSHNLRAIVRDAPEIADGCDSYMIAVASAHSLVSQEEARANAALIARATSLHHELVSALEKARQRIDYLGMVATGQRHQDANEATFLPEIDAVLAKAKQPNLDEPRG